MKESKKTIASLLVSPRNPDFYGEKLFKMFNNLLAKYDVILCPITARLQLESIQADLILKKLVSKMLATKKLSTELDKNEKAAIEQDTLRGVSSLLDVFHTAAKRLHLKYDILLLNDKDTFPKFTDEMTNTESVDEIEKLITNRDRAKKLILFFPLELTKEIGNIFLRNKILISEIETTKIIQPIAEEKSLPPQIANFLESLAFNRVRNELRHANVFPKSKHVRSTDLAKYLYKILPQFKIEELNNFLSSLAQIMSYSSLSYICYEAYAITLLRCLTPLYYPLNNDAISIFNCSAHLCVKTELVSMVPSMHSTTTLEIKEIILAKLLLFNRNVNLNNRHKYCSDNLAQISAFLPKV